MNTIVRNKVRDYIYRNLDNAIYMCDADCRAWYLTASYADCREIFISEIWTEDDRPPYDGFNMISEKVRESDIEDIESLFEEVLNEVLREEYKLVYRFFFCGKFLEVEYSEEPQVLDLGRVRMEVEVYDLKKGIRHRPENGKGKCWYYPECEIRIEDKE